MSHLISDMVVHEANPLVTEVGDYIVMEDGQRLFDIFLPDDPVDSYFAPRYDPTGVVAPFIVASGKHGQGGVADSKIPTPDLEAFLSVGPAGSSASSNVAPSIFAYGGSGVSAVSNSTIIAPQLEAPSLTLLPSQNGYTWHPILAPSLVALGSVCIGGLGGEAQAIAPSTTSYGSVGVSATAYVTHPFLAIFSHLSVGVSAEGSSALAIPQLTASAFVSAPGYIGRLQLSVAAPSSDAAGTLYVGGLAANAKTNAPSTTSYGGVGVSATAYTASPLLEVYARLGVGVSVEGASDMAPPSLIATGEAHLARTEGSLAVGVLAPTSEATGLPGSGGPAFVWVAAPSSSATAEFTHPTVVGSSAGKITIPGLVSYGVMYWGVTEVSLYVPSDQNELWIERA